MEDLQKIRAKSVVKNKFWILQQNNVKVGQAKEVNKDIEVTIHGVAVGKYKSLSEMKKTGLFEFIELEKLDGTNLLDVHGYPACSTAHNAVWNARYRLPLYTQDVDSKSWYAAGYYKIKVGNTWVVQYCPKLIALQRSNYKGPFKTDPGLLQFNKIFE